MSVGSSRTPRSKCRAESTITSPYFSSKSKSKGKATLARSTKFPSGSGFEWDSDYSEAESESELPVMSLGSELDSERVQGEVDVFEGNLNLKEDGEEAQHDSDSESCSSSSLSVLYEKLGRLKPLLIQERVSHDPWKLLIAVTLLNKTTAKVALPVFWEIVSRWGTPWELARADVAELRHLLHPLGTYTIRSNRLIQISKAYMKDPPNRFDARPSRVRVRMGISTPSPSSSDSALISPSRTSGSSQDSLSSPSFSSPSTSPPDARARLTTRYPPTPISHLPGTGPYALDSYRIFCTSHDNLLSQEWKDVKPSDKELVRFLKWKWAYEEHKEWSPLLGIVCPARKTYLSALIQELERERVWDYGQGLAEGEVKAKLASQPTRKRK